MIRLSDGEDVGTRNGGDRRGEGGVDGGENREIRKIEEAGKVTSDAPRSCAQVAASPTSAAQSRFPAVSTGVTFAENAVGRLVDVLWLWLGERGKQCDDNNKK